MALLLSRASRISFGERSMADTTKDHRGIPSGAHCTDNDCWCWDPTRNPQHEANQRKTLFSSNPVSNERLAELLEEHWDYKPDAPVVPSTLRMGELSSILLELHQRRGAHETSEARDAARYRFLRQPDNAIVYAKDRHAWGQNVSGHVRWETPEQLDAAVDAARGAVNGGDEHA